MQPKICFVTTGDIRVNATAKRALGLVQLLGDLDLAPFVVLWSLLAYQVKTTSALMGSQTMLRQEPTTHREKPRS